MRFEEAYCGWTARRLTQEEAAQLLGVCARTTQSYIDRYKEAGLDGLLDKRLTGVSHRRAPVRFYIRDSGILHRLLGISDYDDLLSNPVLGKSWEGFVIENILSVLPNRIESYFYRTAAGAEIDLVLKLSSRETWAIDIKHGQVPQVKSGFHQGAKDINATKKFVVYGGDDEFSIKNDTTVISLTGLMVKLEKL